MAGGDATEQLAGVTRSCRGRGEEGGKEGLGEVVGLRGLLGTVVRRPQLSRPRART